ncbi:MAG: gamma-glutamyl-gamma-aminobutyrate hydrolase family protein [Thermoleophilia bacterium]|nr:gamma-glutamyl-gamma-aminobutyrate hydrolase family protein [Thermoleophilia bacterium]
MSRRGGKPLVAFSVGHHDFGDYQSVGFQRPIALAGGIPLTLSRLNAVLDDALALVDAVVIGGGRDIEPHRYGQVPHEALGPPDPHRDEFELELVGRALERGLPLLGMCRGSQVLNVALGGTLVQDVALAPGWASHPTDRGWHRWKELERASLEGEEAVPAHPRHEIAVEPGSRLHAALGVETIEVNSFHHQAIDRLGTGLRATGVAPDGVVEVIELESNAYVLGAQFELQEEWRLDHRFLEVFRQFVAAAGRR